MSPPTHELIKRIQDALNPTLLKRGYGQSGHWLAGHCYVATEALYHRLPDRENWTPQMGKDDSGSTHWWLRHKLTGEILDPTSEQYTDYGKEPPYANGRGCGFLTKRPSGRALILMKRIMW